MLLLNLSVKLLFLSQFRSSITWLATCQARGVSIRRIADLISCRFNDFALRKVGGAKSKKSLKALPNCILTLKDAKAVRDGGGPIAQVDAGQP